ncbi:unnamed protein product [Brassica oleracea]
MDLRRRQWSLSPIFLAATVVTLLFELQLSAAATENLVFEVRSKFSGKIEKDLRALKAHDAHRHSRLLSSAIDLPLGGDSWPTGQYFAKIGLGTPSRDFHVQVDTGSDLLWVNCAGCIRCPRKSDLMGNDAMAQVAGIGDVCLETSLGTRLVLKDVKHLWMMNTRISGLEPWMRRWILSRRTILLSWWNCLRARRLCLISGCTELSMRMIICHLDTRLDCQKKGIDYDEIFSPVVKMSSIRVVLGLAASLDLEVEQMDVKTAFLHGNLEEEVYMEQPEGYVQKGKENLVCRLIKNLYGLKQAPRQWYMKFKSVMGEHGYAETDSDHCVFVKSKVLSTPLAAHLRLSSQQSPKTYAEKEDMAKVPYASAVGSLMYTMVCTRPDLAYAVGVVSRFLSNPGREHWNAVNYTDSDMSGDADSSKSTSGYLVTFAGGAVAWQSRLQKCVALSTTEAEFIAAVEACKELFVFLSGLRSRGFSFSHRGGFPRKNCVSHLVKLTPYDSDASSTAQPVSCDDSFCSYVYQTSKCHSGSNTKMKAGVKRCFAHCLDNKNGGGIFAIGEVVSPKVKTTPMLSKSDHYSVSLTSVEVGNSVLQLSSGEEVIVDSGTTLAYLPNSVYMPLMNEILVTHPELTFHNVQDLQGSFICFRYTDDKLDRFPPVTFYFNKSASLTVYPQDYLLQLQGDAWCFGWQSSGFQTKDGRELLILGDMALSNKLVVYDIENQVMGWTNHNCSGGIQVKDEQSGSIYTVGAHNLSWSSSLAITKLLTLVSLLVHFLFYH